MGVVCVYIENEQINCIIEQLSETQWIQKNGKALINLKIILRCKNKVDKLIIVLPYKISNIKDTSDDWLKFSNVAYYSKTSGDYYKIIDSNRRLIEDREGIIKINKINKISLIENKLPKEEFIKKRFYTDLTIELLFPLQGNERNLFQLEYTIYNFAFKRFSQYIFTSNWYFVNRYYSIYDLWDSKNKTSHIINFENKIIPLKRIDNWVALPGFARSAIFHPQPKIQSIVTIKHPGYLESILKIKSQMIARFTFFILSNKNIWYCKEVFCEYEPQPIPYWMAFLAFWVTLVALIIAILSFS